jgi:hypothetical protein
MPSANNTDRELLRRELERSILVDPEDRAFWLSQVETLSISSVKRILSYIQPKNAKVDDFIETALAQDQKQEHLAKLKQQFAQIKREAFLLEEKGQTTSEQKQEEDLLKQLEDT